MKKLLLLLVFPLLVHGQTATQNYIKTTKYRVPTPTILPAPTPGQAAVNVTYYDALGRPTQQVAAGQSATGKDIVTPFEYDGYGRQPRQFLSFPKTSATMAFDAAAITNAQAYYDSVYGAGNPLEQADAFSESVFEASPLNRAIEQGAPGADWKVNPAFSAPHTVRTEYLNNSTADAVKLFKVPVSMINVSGYYPITLTQALFAENQLSKVVTKDENWTEDDGKNNTTEEYMDKEGNLVLKRAFNAGVPHDTYYVYDTFGKLTYVIPPLVTGTIDGTVLDNLCYQYRYDYRNRMVERKIPGKQWEYIVYDIQDRIVATGPVNTPFGGPTTGWLLTQYDGFGRTALTGWYPASGINSTLRKALQDTYINPVPPMIRGNSTIDGVLAGYQKPALPTGFKLLTLSYYDDYAFLDSSMPLPAVTTDLDYINTGGSITPKGLPTGSWIRVLTAASATDGQTSYILYDWRSRPIREYTKNYLGGYTYTDRRLSYTGMPLYSTTYHKLKGTILGDPLTVREDFTYDNQERIIRDTYKINSDPVQLLAYNKYSELGLLDYKRVGGTDLSGTTGLQKIDYSYNIRGWLTGINNVNALDVAGDPADLFAFKINYSTVENCLNYTGTPLYNGNVSETYWRSSSDNILRKYGYKYDNLSRLSQAIYQKPGLAVPVTNSYNESLSYDKNGNITALSRNGYYDSNAGEVYTIDKLAYTYIRGTNQLAKVEDVSNSLDGFRDADGTDYTYDANGNQILDGNKGLKITAYNHLNLPTDISFANGKITYIYNAAGEKVSEVIAETGKDNVVTRYDNGFQYITDVLRFFPTAEGYVSVNNGRFNYVYNYTDHLGNVRLSFLKDPEKGVLSVLEENNYYPFGLKHENYNSQKYKLVQSVDGVSIVLQPTERNIYQYKYQGQERQDELGLNWDSYKWRNYDYAIGRFMSIDPLTEEYNTWAPYVFSGNRVVDSREIEGLEPWSMTKQQEADRKEAVNAFWRNSPIDYIAVGVTTVTRELLNLYPEKGSTAIHLDGTPATGNGLDLVHPGSFLTLEPPSKIIKNNGSQGGPTAGKSFTQKQKIAAKEANANENKGNVICESCDVKTVAAKKSELGVTPPKNEAQVDHIYPKSKGGNTTPENTQILCRDCNIKKSNKIPK